MSTDMGWASIRLDMIGGTDSKSAARIFGEVQNCVVLITLRPKPGAPQVPPFDVKILEVGCVEDGEEDVWGFRCQATDDDGDVIADAAPFNVRFEDVDAIGVY